ncbi:MAG: endonuclease/exonuclease/phosphatase family protein [Candidatus Gastranaerophilales bacterium]|nr:endonuclease/exonuclease/phosphatase family protein [Candidatus Gastranaerophilales bacterium]
MVKKFFLHNLNGFLFWTLFGTILGFFSKYCFLTDICCHFKFQYIYATVIILIFYLAMKIKDKKLYAAILLVLILNTAEIIRCIVISPPEKPFSVQQNEEQKPIIKIGLINLLTSNTHYQSVRDEILNSNADIFVIEEINTDWSGELEEIKKVYPYNYEYLREDNFGLAIYSKIPVKQFNVLYAGNFALPVLTAMIEYNGKITEIIAVHTTPPTSNAYFKNTQSMLEDIAKYVQTRQLPTVIVGDINSSRFSYNYANFIKKTKMKDCGSIFQTTWTAFWLPPMRITLDHIFVTKDFGVADFKVGNKVGSDHFPVFAEVY